jgi:hypothetical protein
MNKKNDTRRAQSKFISNLDDSRAQIVFRYLLETVQTNVSVAEKKTLNDELTENIAVMFPAMYTKGILDELLIGDVNAFDALKGISKMSAKMNPGLSNKSIFKYMDMVDAFQRPKK